MKHIINNSYAIHMGVIMEEEVVLKLIEKKYHIAFAESCTGGLCAARLINVANASKVLNVSFVTYSNEAKNKYLGVSFDTIEKYDVVSIEVAKEMAKGAALNTESTVGVGVTGVAGPTGGSDLIPLGTVCFGFYINGALFGEKIQFGNIGRNNVRKAATDYVFKRLNELL